MARILLADDNIDLRTLLAEVLQAAGHEVVEVGDGRSAIAALRAGGFVMVVTDVVMPEADGAEVMNALRQLRPKPRLVVISGGGKIAPERYLQMARALGADEVLQKPFLPSRLVEVVTRLIGPAVPPS
jgi:CheY-like chemotaxis protein